MIFVETRLGIAGVEINHADHAVEYFKRHREHAANVADDDALSGSERTRRGQIVAKHGHAFGQHLRHDGTAGLHGVILSGAAVPAEN